MAIKWMRAGRPRKKEPVVKVTQEAQGIEMDETWSREELMIFSDGYVALAAAVIRQCKKDKVKLEEYPPLFKDLLDCYAESMMKRLGEYSVGSDEEGE